jgi:CBS domain-containing protein
MGSSLVTLEDGYVVHPRYVLVLDANQALVGVVSRRDLLRGLGETPQQRSIDSTRERLEQLVPFPALFEGIAFGWMSLFSTSAINNAREPVTTVMAPIKGVAGLDDDLSTVVNTMLSKQIDLVPVVDRGVPVGVVLMTDVFDVVAEFISEHPQA